MAHKTPLVLVGIPIRSIRVGQELVRYIVKECEQIRKIDKCKQRWQCNAPVLVHLEGKVVVRQEEDVLVNPEHP